MSFELLAPFRLRPLGYAVTKAGAVTHRRQRFVADGRKGRSYAGVDLVPLDRVDPLFQFAAIQGERVADPED